MPHETHSGFTKFLQLADRRIIEASQGPPTGAQLANEKVTNDMHAVREFANKSAASAASLDSVKFQAMIKSAASAASPKAKSREGSSRGAPRSVVRTDPSSGRPRRPTEPRRPGAPLELPPLDFAFGEACLLYTSPSPRDVEESRMPSSA